eukprot:Filipodium_phascolosomae@DN2710_c0_g1_i1.p1
MKLLTFVLLQICIVLTCSCKWPTDSADNFREELTRLTMHLQEFETRLKSITDHDTHSKTIKGGKLGLAGAGLLGSVLALFPPTSAIGISLVVLNFAGDLVIHEKTMKDFTKKHLSPVFSRADELVDRMSQHPDSFDGAFKQSVEEFHHLVSAVLNATDPNFEKRRSSSFSAGGGAASTAGGAAFETFKTGGKAARLVRQKAIKAALHAYKAAVQAGSKAGGAAGKAKVIQATTKHLKWMKVVTGKLSTILNGCGVGFGGLNVALKTVEVMYHKPTPEDLVELLLLSSEAILGAREDLLNECSFKY